MVKTRLPPGDDEVEDDDKEEDDEKDEDEVDVAAAVLGFLVKVWLEAVE